MFGLGKPAPQPVASPRADAIKAINVAIAHAMAEGVDLRRLADLLEDHAATARARWACTAPIM